jgi:two-component system, NarL family, sensor histidine kinase DesK
MNNSSTSPAPNCAPTASPRLTPPRRERSFLIRYIWLVYSAFFFVQPVMHPTLREWLIFVPFYLFFLFLYIYPDINRRAAPWCILTMAILGFAYVPYNQGAYGIFIFVAAFLPFLVESTRRVIILLVVFAALIALHGVYFHLYPWICGSIVAFSLVLGIANLTQAREKRANSRLLRAQEEIEHLATVAERERIARDLHDLLGHTLSVITLKAELAGKLLHSDPDRAAAEIADVEQTARRALAEVREAVGGYRAQGLPAEIARARQTLAATGVELTAADPPIDLPPADETVLALILREAITNIVRHAKATSCNVQFATSRDHILVTISDNGRGGLLNEGNGLRGMRERAIALGGQFSWESAAAPRHGVKLSIQLPLRPAPAAAVGPTSKLREPLPDLDPILAEPRS